MPKHSLKPPVRLPRNRWNSFDPEAFIEAYRSTLCLYKACQQCRVAYSTVKKHCDIDPEFKQAFDDVTDAKVNELETVTFQRAIKGWKEPIAYKGKIMSYKTVYSPQLMMFLLRSHRPKTYNQPETDDRMTVEEQANALLMFIRQANSVSQIKDN